MVFALLAVEETPIVLLAKCVCLMKMKRVDVKMDVISTMTVPWVQPVSMGIVLTHVWVLMSVGQMQFVKLCPMQQHASAQRVPESSIHLM